MFLSLPQYGCCNPAGISLFINGWPSTLHINVQGILTDTALTVLGDPQFKHLEVSYSQVTAQQLLEALLKMPQLEHLSAVGSAPSFVHD